MRRRAFTGWDAALLAGLLALNGWLLRGWRANAAGTVEITSDGGRQVIALEPARRLEIAGPLGPAILALGHDGARFVSSPCPNQVCIRAGAARRAGDVVACLPNRIAVRLPKADPAAREGVDAIAR